MTVKAHNGLTKPRPSGETTADERLVGFQFPNHPGTTPFDFAVDGNTGLVKRGATGALTQPGQPLWGVKCQSLVEGISDATLPPLSIWKAGRWLNDIDQDDAPIYDLEVDGWKNIENNIWLVSGEGSPGCYAFLAFFIPNQESDSHTPKHPMLWGADWKTKKSGPFRSKTHKEFNGTPKDPRKAWLKTWEILEYGFLFDSLEKTKDAIAAAEKKEAEPWRMSQWDWYDRDTSSPKVSTPPGKPAVNLPGPKTTTNTVASMPVGVRFRCPGCGHWYKETDFVTHGKNSLCPALDDGIADWTVECDVKCGCELIEGFPSALHTLGDKTLDHVSTPKPGFPRPKREEVKTVTESTETPDEGGTEEGTESTEGTEEGTESTEEGS